MSSKKRQNVWINKEILHDTLTSFYILFTMAIIGVPLFLVHLEFIFQMGSLGFFTATAIFMVCAGMDATRSSSKSEYVIYKRLRVCIVLCSIFSIFSAFFCLWGTVYPLAVVCKQFEIDSRAVSTITIIRQSSFDDGTPRVDVLLLKYNHEQKVLYEKESIGGKPYKPEQVREVNASASQFPLNDEIETLVSKELETIQAYVPKNSVSENIHQTNEAFDLTLNELKALKQCRNEKAFSVAYATCLVIMIVLNFITFFCYIFLF